MGGAGLHSRHVCSGGFTFSGGYMTDMELVSFCAIAMALLNLFLIHQLTQARRATSMAWEILSDVAKGDVTIAWDGKGIRVTAINTKQ